jgi:hypothetical protein
MFDNPEAEVDDCVQAEQQVEKLIGKTMPLLAELDDRVRRLSLPDSASEKTRTILQCLPVLIDRPHRQLRAISDARLFAAGTVDIVIIVGALWDFLILTGNALKEARAIGDRLAQRRQLVNLDARCGAMFSQMNTIANALHVPEAVSRPAE